MSKREPDIHFGVRRRPQLALQHRRAVEAAEVAAVVDQLLPGRHARRRVEQLDLLGRVVRDRGRPAQRVEVVLEEGFFLEPRRRRCVHLRHLVRLRPQGLRRCLDAVHIARDQLELRVLVARARLVEEAHPGADVDEARVRVRAFGEDQVVVRPPGDAARLVGHARLLRATLPRNDVPLQRRPRDQPAGQLAEADVAPFAQRMDLAVGAADHEPVVRRDQRAVDELHAVAALLLDADVPVDVAREQLVLAHEVELEVLLQHLGAFGIREREELHGRRVDQRRDVRELDGAAPARDRKFPVDAHQREAGQLVRHRRAHAGQRPVPLGRNAAGLRGAVNRERSLGLGRGGAEREQDSGREQAETSGRQRHAGPSLGGVCIE